MNIEKMLAQDNAEVKSHLLQALQEYVLSGSLTEQELRDTIGDMVIFTDVNHVIFEDEAHDWSFSDKFFKLTQIIIDYKDDYPDDINAAKLLKTLEDNYGEIVLNKLDYHNDGLHLFFNVAVTYWDKYIAKHGGAEHTLVVAYSELNAAVEKLLQHPENMDELWLFWYENGAQFSPQYMNATDFFSEEKLIEAHAKTHAFPHVEGHQEANNFLELVDIYKKQGELYRENIAKNLFTYFTEHPQLHEKLSTHFPAVYQFARWLPDVELKKIHTHFTIEHIEVLKSYQHDEGYAEYLRVLMSTKYIRQERKQSMMMKMAHNPMLFDHLFGEHHGFSAYLRTQICRLDKNNKIISTDDDIIQSIITTADHSRLQQSLPEKGMVGKKLKL